MQTTQLGDPLPSNAAEMVEAFSWTCDIPPKCEAVVEPPSAQNIGGIYEGWTAEVFNNEGDSVFATVGFPTEDSLVAALAASGVTEYRVAMPE
jgi:hypothetical protein